MRTSLLMLALLLSGPALAVTTPTSESAAAPETLEDWLHDLEASRGADRLLAARELRRRARSAHRRLGGSAFARLEAEVGRDELIHLAVGPIGRALIDDDRVRAPLADAALALETPALLSALREALRLTERPRAIRHLSRAIAAIEALPASAP
ncbi:MAG: hypothetical protein JXX28_11205 [Deltaproteobacteria bacterium]|nr:hypothetical protein [Deltaproteobacteria bacterium]